MSSMQMLSLSLKNLQKFTSFFWNPTIEETSTTIGMEMDTKPMKMKGGIEFTIFDFAGQMEYSSVHQVTKTN